MDRYNMHHNEAGQCLEECVEPDGEWVTYDDAMTEIAELKEIVKAVAHIGVDFGYGEFKLDNTHIKKARKLMEKK